MPAEQPTNTNGAGQYSLAIVNRSVYSQGSSSAGSVPDRDSDPRSLPDPPCGSSNHGTTEHPHRSADNMLGGMPPGDVQVDKDVDPERQLLAGYET